MWTRVLSLVLLACVDNTTVTVPPAPTTSTSQARAEPFDVPAQLGELRCLGWSAARGIALCFVGQVSAGAAPDVNATFVALGNTHAPEDVPLPVDATLQSFPTANIPPATLAKLRATVAGFTGAWDATATLDGNTTGALQVGSVELSVRRTQTDPGGENAAPRFHVELHARVGSKDDRVDAVDGPVSRYTVRAYAAGGALLAHRTYDIADEGQFEHHADVVVVCRDCAGERR